MWKWIWKFGSTLPFKGESLRVEADHELWAALEGSCAGRGLVPAREPIESPRAPHLLCNAHTIKSPTPYQSAATGGYAYSICDKANGKLKKLWDGLKK